jgi:glucuronoarabinoxylan endo-1,4-beta-xylanase
MVRAGYEGNVLFRYDVARRKRRKIGVFSLFCGICLLALSVAAQSGLTVNFSDVLQHIDGFGVTDSYLGAFSDAQADLLFSPTAGIGLSILRTGIDSSGHTMSAYSNLTKAAARGAIVWAYPFTAPAGYKDNGSEDNGGNLLVADYANWANVLAGYQATVVANGGPNLYGISVQGEPDFSASYASMLYSDSAMAAFIDVLGPKLAALSPAPRLIMPETADWHNLGGYVSAVAGDSTAQSYVSIVATHQYGGILAPGSNFRPIWETEMSYFNGFDATMTSGLIVAQAINDAFVIGGVSAWHWWWAIRTNQSDNEGLTDTTTPTKRLYTMGNFSKFVRPGFVMVGASGAPSGVSATAYKNPGTGAFVIVAINQNGSDTPLNVALNGMSASSVTPWITSASLNLVQQAALAVSGGSFTATLPAQSVTSFVGTGGGGILPPAAPTGLVVR